MSQDNLKREKPIPLRVIFILNGLMMVLPFIFYYAVSSGNLNVGINPMIMAYTGIAYILSFTLLVTSILKRKIKLIRGIIILNVIIALPAKAVIAIAVAIISFALTYNGQVKAYFAK